jgi:hypothetical protein
MKPCEPPFWPHPTAPGANALPLASGSQPPRRRGPQERGPSSPPGILMDGFNLGPTICASGGPCWRWWPVVHTFPASTARERGPRQRWLSPASACGRRQIWGDVSVRPPFSLAWGGGWLWCGWRRTGSVWSGSGPDLCQGERWSRKSRGPRPPGLRGPGLRQGCPPLPLLRRTVSSKLMRPCTLGCPVAAGRPLFLPVPRVLPPVSDSA